MGSPFYQYFIGAVQCLEQRGLPVGTEIFIVYVVNSSKIPHVMVNGTTPCDPIEAAFAKKVYRCGISRTSADIDKLDPEKQGAKDIADVMDALVKNTERTLFKKVDSMSQHFPEDAHFATVRWFDGKTEGVLVSFEIHGKERISYRR